MAEETRDEKKPTRNHDQEEKKSRTKYFMIGGSVFIVIGLLIVWSFTYSEGLRAEDCNEMYDFWKEKVLGELEFTFENMKLWHVIYEGETCKGFIDKNQTRYLNPELFESYDRWLAYMEQENLFDDTT